MAIGKWVLFVLATLSLGALVVGQLGLLSGRAPRDLGVRDGRLKPPSKTPNSVSSQADLWPGPRSADARIDPIVPPANTAATLVRLRTIVEGMPGATVVEARPDYLYVQFTTRWMKYVDDTEFWLDPAAHVIHVRSASRVGRKDFGVNRERIEAIRARLNAP